MRLRNIAGSHSGCLWACYSRSCFCHPYGWEFSGLPSTHPSDHQVGRMAGIRCVCSCGTHPPVFDDVLEKLFKHRVLRILLNEEAISEDVVESMLSWHHPPSLTLRRPSRLRNYIWLAGRSLGEGWARLIKKVYETEPLVCPRCFCLLKPIAFIEDPDVMQFPGIKRFYISAAAFSSSTMVTGRSRNRRAVTAVETDSMQEVVCRAVITGRTCSGCLRSGRKKRRGWQRRHLFEASRSARLRFCRNARQTDP